MHVENVLEGKSSAQRTERILYESETVSSFFIYDELNEMIRLYIFTSSLYRERQRVIKEIFKLYLN